MISKSGVVRFSVTLAAIVVVAGLPVTAQAELILVNGKIATLMHEEGFVEALSIRDGRVFEVGSAAQVLASRDARSRVIDLGGRTVIPGLNDSHSHVVRGGRFYNLELRWDGITTLQEALDRVAEQARRTPPGHWVRVIGAWSPSQFAEKRMPTVEELNAAAPDTPVFVLISLQQGLPQSCWCRSTWVGREQRGSRRKSLRIRGRRSGAHRGAQSYDSVPNNRSASTALKGAAGELYTALLCRAQPVRPHKRD